ncbi:hypothetical protein GCG54_00010940 [Colletotrichum gloeosporioides]|uniref:Uncharacterized protein n=2 Tax=Colletotrichum gloeosporioides species complex TaxID=2707338 RepID=A0A8H4CRE6_COLGL|nr:uncharacterized protein GCG54_00010940 [Colletotrichum gloeosporioides]KAF3808750.1 hypothetical protein GCG54_00010940 [Colletotrichum gloeosporioides]
MRFFFIIALSAISIGQASAQATPQETVSTSCKTVPECGQNNIGAACTMTCQDNPGGERKVTGTCKAGTFGVNCLS